MSVLAATRVGDHYAKWEWFYFGVIALSLFTVAFSALGRGEMVYFGGNLFGGLVCTAAAIGSYEEQFGSEDAT